MRKLLGVESVISSLPSTILLLCHTTTTPAPSGPHDPTARTGLPRRPDRQRRCELAQAMLTATYLL